MGFDDDGVLRFPVQDEDFEPAPGWRITAILPTGSTAKDTARETKETG